MLNVDSNLSANNLAVLLNGSVLFSTLDRVLFVRQPACNERLTY